MTVEYKKIDDLILWKIVENYGEWVKKYIFVRDDAFALAALDGDMPIGFICVTPRDLTYPLEHIKDAYIQDLEVHEHYRRQGIARHLVTCAEAWAVNEGYKQIRTHHNDEAAAAIQLSNSLNYGLCPHDYWIDGKKYSGYWVAKILTTQ